MMRKTKRRKGAPDSNKSDCKYVIHVQLTNDTAPSRRYTTTSKDFSKKALAYLIDQNLFEKDSKYVCDVCINYGLERLTVKKQ